MYPHGTFLGGQDGGGAHWRPYPIVVCITGATMKAQDNSLVVLMILCLVFLIFGFVFYDNLYDAVKGGQSHVECKLSVQLYTDTLYQAGGATLFEGFPQNCKKRIIQVQEDGIIVNGRESSFYDGIQEKEIDSYDDFTYNDANALLADELVGCWDKFHKGTVPLVKKEWWSTSTDRYCHVCAEVDFADEVAITGEKESFMEYLSKAQVKKQYRTDLTTQQTAFDALFGQESACSDMWSTYVAEDVIPPASPCVLEYMYVWHHLATEKGWLGQQLEKVGIDRPDALNIGDFVNPDLTIDKERYLVMLYVQSPGTVQKASGIDTILGIFRDEPIARPDEPTHIAWVTPASNVNVNVCTEYFG